MCGYGGKDTVDDASTLKVSALRKVKLNKFPKATGVVVIDGFGVSKCLHDGATKQREKSKGRAFVFKGVFTSILF